MKSLVLELCVNFMLRFINDSPKLINALEPDTASRIMGRLPSDFIFELFRLGKLDTDISEFIKEELSVIRISSTKNLTLSSIKKYEEASLEVLLMKKTIGGHEKFSAGIVR